MKIDLISDTHEKHAYLVSLYESDADMIIFAGDAANDKRAEFNEKPFYDFCTWFENLPHKYKIFVPGNHDTSFEKGFVKKENFPGIMFLVNEEIIIEGIKIYGSPMTPSFGHGWAYNCVRNKIEKYWNMIPKDTDILITHGPPMGIMDITLEYKGLYKQVGCKVLKNKVLEIQPKYHIFGHLHDESSVFNHGTKTLGNKCKTIFINPTIVNIRHKQINQPITIEM
jgi:Icc-related predicted phosphoesterase